MVSIETSQELPQTYPGHSYDTGGYFFKAQLMWQKASINILQVIAEFSSLGLNICAKVFSAVRNEKAPTLMLTFITCILCMSP